MLSLRHSPTPDTTCPSQSCRTSGATGNYGASQHGAGSSQIAPRCSSACSRSTNCASSSGSGEAESSWYAPTALPLEQHARSIQQLTTPSPVLPPRHPPLHHPPPPSPPHLRSPPPLPRLHQPPPQRPLGPPLRPAGKLLRRHPLHVQIPHLAVVAPGLARPASNQHLGPQHHRHQQSDILPRAAAARALAVPRLATRRRSRLGRRHRVPPRLAARRARVAGPRVDGGRG